MLHDLLNMLSEIYSPQEIANRQNLTGIVTGIQINFNRSQYGLGVETNPNDPKSLNVVLSDKLFEELNKVKQRSGLPRLESKDLIVVKVGDENKMIPEASLLSILNTTLKSINEDLALEYKPQFPKIVSH